MKLEELKQKYGGKGMRYEPDTNCEYCHGSGEAKSAHPRFPLRPCICLFIQSDFAGQLQKIINFVAQDEGKPKE